MIQSIKHICLGSCLSNSISMSLSFQSICAVYNRVSAADSLEGHECWRWYFILKIDLLYLVFLSLFICLGFGSSFFFLMNIKQNIKDHTAPFAFGLPAQILVILDFTCKPDFLNVQEKGNTIWNLSEDSFRDASTIYGTHLFFKEIVCICFLLFPYILVRAL